MMKGVEHELGRYYRVGVAAEPLNILLHPLKGGTLILQTEIESIMLASL
jgi:hypothetical protein